MARPRKISDDDALTGAAAVFRRDGFDAASLVDLETAAGLNRRGLADRFGDKRGLFRAALARYAAAVEAAYFAPMRLPPDAPGAGLAAIRGGFARLLADGLAEGTLGCMMVEASRQEIGRDPEIRAAIEAYAGAMQEAFAAALSAAQAKGELPPEVDLTALNHFLCGVVIGLQAMLRADVPEPAVRDYLRLSLERLPPAAP